MRKIKGIYVDPFERVNTMVETTKDIREIQKLLKVDLLEVFNPSRVGGPDIELWVDEMGALRENPGWWFGSWNQLFAGRCFICKPGLKTLPKSQAYSLVCWIRPGMTESCKQIAHLNRARIISGPKQFQQWQRDVNDCKTMLSMLALAVEEAPLLP